VVRDWIGGCGRNQTGFAAGAVAGCGPEPPLAAIRADSRPVGNVAGSWIAMKPGTIVRRYPGRRHIACTSGPAIDLA